MSKKQNTAEKYLTTARTSLIDYIFAALIGIGVFLFIFWWAYYGMIAMLIGIIGLICTRASKIKDEEFDEELRLALRDNNVEITSNCRLEIFDLCRGPVTFTKEKKARSGFFVITEFFFKEEKCDIIKHDVDIVGEAVTTEHYTIALPSSTAIEEQEVSTPAGKRKMAYLLVGDARIPVDITSLDTDDIIKKFA
jgi:hypothetical protein